MMEEEKGREGGTKRKREGRKKGEKKNLPGGLPGPAYPPTTNDKGSLNVIQCFTLHLKKKIRQKKKKCEKNE